MDAYLRARNCLRKKLGFALGHWRMCISLILQLCSKLRGLTWRSFEIYFSWGNSAPPHDFF